MIALVLQLLALTVCVSVVGDVIHAALHVSLHARGLLRLPGLLHHTHHRWLDEQLRFHPDRYWRNIACHQVPEFALHTVLAVVIGQLTGCATVVMVARILSSLGTVAHGVSLRGHDDDHLDARPLPAPSSLFVVDGAHHALHHLFPDHFLAARWGLVDVVFGRLLPLRGRMVVVTGDSPWLRALALALEREGARVAHQQELGPADALSSTIAAADIVVLGHSAQRRDELSYEALCERALVARTAAAPLDIWAVGASTTWQARAPLFSQRAIVRQLVQQASVASTPVVAQARPRLVVASRAARSAGVSTSTRSVTLPGASSQRVTAVRSRRSPRSTNARTRSCAAAETHSGSG